MNGNRRLTPLLRARMLNNRVYQMVSFLLMRTRWHRFFLIFLISLSLTIGTVPVNASKTLSTGKTQIIVGGEIGYQPYSFLDKNGDPTGFQVELIRAIARTMGINVEIRLKPWPETRKALEDGTIDIIPGMFYSEERAQIFDFSPPFAIVSTAIFARINSPSIKSVDDLRNKEIIVMRGEAMHDYILKHRLTDKILLTETPADALRLLASGKGNYALVAQMPGFYWIKELNLSNIKSVGPSLQPFKNCFAVRKGNTLLLSRFTEGLSIINQTGEYGKLYEKWLGVLEPTGIDLLLVIKYAAIVFVPLILLLAISFVWSWLLRNKVNQKTKELMNTEERYRTLVENASDIIFRTDNTGHLTFVNPAAIHITGYEEDEIIGMHYPSLIRLDMRDKAIKFFGRQFVKGINNVYSEYPIITKDGHEVWLGQNTQLIVEAGNVTGFQSVARDITERRYAQEALLDSKTKFQFLSESMSDVVFTVDMNMATTYVSPSIEKMLGFTPAERMIQKLDEQLTPKSQKLIFDSLLAELNREKEKGADPDRSVTMELEFYHKDGSIKHLSTYLRGIRNSEGKLTGFYGSHHDITERKKAEEMLMEITGRLRLATSAAKAGVWDWNIQTNEMIWDDRMLELYGLTHDIFPGGVEAWEQGLHPDDSSKAIEECQVALRGERDFDTEFRVLRPEGTMIYIKANGIVLRDEEGKPLRMIGLNTDITERKQAEQSLRLFKDLVEHSSDAIGMSTPEGKHYYQNEAFDCLFGEIGDHPPETVYADKEIGKQVFDTIMGGRSWQGEVKMFKKDRTILEILLRAYAIRNQDGRIIGLVGLHTDITERKRAEEKLFEREEDLAITLRSIGDAMIATDIEGKVTRMNPVAEQLTGWSLAEASGKPLKNIFRSFRLESEDPQHIVVAA